VVQEQGVDGVAADAQAAAGGGGAGSIVADEVV
jgi:hypothetical protein